jgi:Rrf2 family protein
MKFSAQEEYGLRCLIRIAKTKNPHGLTIPEISELEGISTANTAKLLRTLRLGNFIESTRGQTGGYKLCKPADEVIIGDVLEVLGGKLFEEDFCNLHTGTKAICTNSIDCSIRSLWGMIQTLLDGLLKKMTLQDLLGKEEKTKETITTLIEEIDQNVIKN